MSFEIESIGHHHPFLDESPNSAQQDNTSKFMRRKMNLEKLSLKSIINHELSKETSASGPSSSYVFGEDDHHRDGAKIIEAAEIKIDSASISSKSPDKSQTERNAFGIGNNDFGFTTQEWLLREQEDGSKSPFPQKKQFEAPLEFSIVLEHNLLKANRTESNQTNGSQESLWSSKMKSQSKFTRLQHDYRIIDVIGKGSFGKVYKCVNRLDENDYAVKETFRKFSGRYKLYGLNETHALASLTAMADNINVVRYYHSWVEEEKLYIVMEYCPSTLTKERKNKGTFSESELKKILRDICLGLKYLHANDIVHLDVKTENILISKNERYKLGDLGQTRKLSESAIDLGDGDCRYLAPELLNTHLCNGPVDYTKMDIFSLGMTLFELVTNHDLPKNGDEWQQLRNEEFEMLEQVPNLSHNFKSIIKLMLSKNPAARPSAQEILDQYLPSEEILDLKWEKVLRGVLEEEKKSLEGKLDNKKKRRRSVG